MASKTPNLGLNIWGREDTLSVAEWTENFTRLDSAVPAAEQSAKDTAKDYTDQKMLDVESQVQLMSDKVGQNDNAVLAMGQVVSSVESTMAALNEEMQDKADLSEVETLVATAEANAKDASLPKNGGELEGITTAHSNTSYTVRQIRNVILSASDADVNAMQDGDLWIKYK